MKLALSPNKALQPTVPPSLRSGGPAAELGRRNEHSVSGSMMKTEELLKIAAAFARGIDPKTGAPLEDQLVALNLKTGSLGSHPTKGASVTTRSVKWANFPLSKEQQALLRSFAEASATDASSLDEFLSRKHAAFLPSLRAIGAEDGEGWSLVKLQWTVEYWRERALIAEAKLRGHV